MLNNKLINSIFSACLFIYKGVKLNTWNKLTINYLRTDMFQCVRVRTKSTIGHKKKIIKTLRIMSIISTYFYNIMA